MQINVILDGPPGELQPGRFVAVEDEDGGEVRIGEWLEHPEHDGYWMLRIETGHVDAPERGDDNTLADGMFWPLERPAATPRWGCRTCGAGAVAPSVARARAEALSHMIHPAHRRQVGLDDIPGKHKCSCLPCRALVNGPWRCGPCQLAHCDYFSATCKAIAAIAALNERAG